MQKIIDTQTTDDPNTFGETLREYAFVEELGCYSCFDLLEEFKPVQKGSNIESKLQMALGIHKFQDNPEWLFNDDLRKVAKFYTNDSIHVGWYWDGDGTLAFLEGGRCAVNTDCKKTDRWKWV